MLMLAFLVLGFAMLDALSEFLVAWLHPTSMRHFLDETIWDVSPWCWLLRAYPSLSAPCDAMFTMFIRTAYWLSLHLYTLAHMSMHKSCLLVCRPCFNTMKLWTFDPNLHLSLVDTTFCLLSYLFAFLLVCLLSCFFACHVYHAYLFYASFTRSLHLFSFHCLSSGFLVFAFTCTHMERGSMKIGHGLPSEHVEISQTTILSRFRGLASPIWFCTLINPLPPSLLSFLDGLY